MTLLSAAGPGGAESVTHIPTMAREVYDVTGAGDTVIAALALALACGAQPGEAALIANHAAGVVVGKVGTATVTRAELAAALHEFPLGRME
jgi:bifunctional ADP-heptose synthase (sugar kinase/adenylyltransferase)